MNDLDNQATCLKHLRRYDLEKPDLKDQKMLAASASFIRDHQDRRYIKENVDKKDLEAYGTEEEVNFLRKQLVSLIWHSF